MTYQVCNIAQEAQCGGCKFEAAEHLHASTPEVPEVIAVICPCAQNWKWPRRVPSRSGQEHKGAEDELHGRKIKLNSQFLHIAGPNYLLKNASSLLYIEKAMVSGIDSWYHCSKMLEGNSLIIWINAETLAAKQGSFQEAIMLEIWPQTLECLCLRQIVSLFLCYEILHWLPVHLVQWMLYLRSICAYMIWSWSRLYRHRH